MTPTLFITFLAVVASCFLALVWRYTSRRAAAGVLAGLLVWFLYASLLGFSGILRNTATRPPGIVFLVVPVLVFLVVFVFKVRASDFALAFPLWTLLALQCFRIGVELFLHRLWLEGLIPRVLTYEGANVDIFIGASAPVAAWLFTRGRTGAGAALVWNVLGLLALLNVVTRSVLTAPGPLNLIHAEVPNRMMSTFPFLLIPGFFVPLAVVLHVMAIKVASRRMAS